MIKNIPGTTRIALIVEAPPVWFGPTDKLKTRKTTCSGKLPVQESYLFRKTTCSGKLPVQESYLFRWGVAIDRLIMSSRAQNGTPCNLLEKIFILLHHYI